MIRNFGYACMNLTLGDTSSRTMRIQNFDLFSAGICAIRNINDLRRMVIWNAENDIRFFRIPSEIFPYADHPILGYKLSQLDAYRHIRRMFEEIGKLARESNQRLTVHPGPFTVIASDNAAFVEKSLRHLDHQAEIGSWLGTPDYAINIHVGRSRSLEAANSFVANFKRLSEAARSYLTVENDDKDNCWAVEDLLEIHGLTGIPIVFDSHHWLFRWCSSMLTSARIALSTWGKRFPKMHHSESKPGPNPRAHSDYLVNPVPQFDIPGSPYDLMLETKAKDLALLRYMKDHGINRIPNSVGQTSGNKS